MPRWKSQDAETGEPLENNAPPPESVGGGHQSKTESVLSIQLSKERLRKLRMQNKKLALDYKAKAGGYVLLEDVKRQVLACNVSVKNQVFAVIERADLTREQKLALRREMIQALNDLAYERGYTRPTNE